MTTTRENLIESANAVITAMAALDRAIEQMPDHLISEAQCIRGALLVEAANRIAALARANTEA
jgi:hypothetical protein